MASELNQGHKFTEFFSIKDRIMVIEMSTHDKKIKIKERERHDQRHFFLKM